MIGHNLTYEEEAVYNKLKEMRKSGERIELSLYPGLRKIIVPEASNTIKVNEERFSNISERFYDEVVDLFDSRYQ